ncbi:TPA: hypothetical protein HA317_04515 [Candidatus Woesearchaeota archaeon]|nr:hypothetical protein [Candidatus Woesearchaeota archaeon]
MPRAYTPPVIFTISDTLGIPVHTLYQLIMVMEIPENLTSLFFIKPYNPLLLDPKSLLRIEKRDKQYKQLIDQGFSRFDIQALNAALAYMPRKKTAVKRF